MGSIDVSVGSVGSFEINPDGIRDVLKSAEVAAELNSHAERIAASMNSEGRGEFRAGVGTRGKNRAHAFVNTYDRHARATANVDPSIFARHAR